MLRFTGFSTLLDFRTLLKKLKEKNVNATFYVIGSRVIERPNMLIDEYMSGHEIGVHTWSHSVSPHTSKPVIPSELP